MDVQPHALITGTSSGIGAAIAAHLLDAGWRVTGISRRAPDIVSSAYAHISMDLLTADAASMRAALADVRPTALVHAAGFLRVGALGAQDQTAGADMWRMHVEVASMLADIVAPFLPDGGRIVLIGSRAAGGSAGRGQYAASKAAVVGLARSWAAELVTRGVTVNVVAPGVTDTAMLRDPARAAVPPNMPPIGRLIRPEEVAALVAYLLSPVAAAITGQTIMICGGGSL